MKPTEDGPELFRGKILYREWGYHLSHLNKFIQAIEFFNKSIELGGGNDLRTLLGLANAFMTFTRYRSSAEIADKCMEIDPHNYQVIWMRVETLYKITEFSLSLIYAYQGQRMRPYPFKWGIYQACETIEDCIGQNTLPTALRELYPWIKKMEDYLKELIAKKDVVKDEFEGIDEDKSRFKINDSNVKSAVYLKKLHRIMAEVYLQLLAKDKHFMEDMLQSPGFCSANKKHNEELENHARLCLLRSATRHEILRSRRPLYFFRFLKKNIPPGHRMFIKNETEIRKNNIIIHANFLLRMLNTLRESRDYARFFRFAEHVKTTFESRSNKMFPMKQKCLTVIYNMVALAYLESRDLSSIKDEERKKVYLKHHIGMYVAKLPRDSEIGWIPTIKKKEALQDFRKKLAMADDPLELTWIFHDFSKLLMETYQFDWARYYAKRARDKSLETKNQAWFMNANHIIIRIEFHQHNKNDAKEAALLSLTVAMTQEIDYLVDFYKGIVKILDEVDFEKMAFIDSISLRQKMIINIMPLKLKAGMDYLFRSMEAVPAKRRLSVMPGCKPVDKRTVFTYKKNTILKSPPKDPEKEARKALLQQYAPSKKILGFVDFREYE